ncbi:MAG: diguanylate cyclase [Pseudomonadota bacterium]
MSPPPPTRWQPSLQALQLAVLVGICCWVTIALTRGDGRVAAIWLSNGLLLGVLLSTPTGDWLRYLIAGFAGNVVANLLSGDALHMAPLLAGCNTLEVILAAWPLRRRLGAGMVLGTSLGLLYFAAFCGLLAPLASSIAASALLGWHGGAPFQATFSVWFPADAMGMIIVTPLVLALRSEADLDASRAQAPRPWLPWLLVVVSGVLVFSQTRYPLLFLVFPPLLVLTYLHGMRGSVLGVATITVIALVGTISGHGPFMLIDTVSMQVRILILQVFLLIAAAQGLVMGMVLSQRERLAQALSRSEQSLRTVTDNLPALIAHVDAEQRYHFANAHIGKIFGGDPQQMIGRTMREVRGEAIYADLAPHVQRALGGETASFENHAQVNGRMFHYQSNYIPERTPDGTVLGFFAMTFDITERKNAELRQAADEERLRIITDNLPALIAYLDRNGIYRFCNGTHADWFGKPVADWIGKHYHDVIDDDFGDMQFEHVQAALKGHRIDTELVLTTRGTPRTVRASYLPHLAAHGQVLGVYLLMNDISSFKTVQAELNRLARYDMLTGLANRREFQERLEAAIHRNRQGSINHALMFLDIDHFKRINDSHGHAAGDAVLREVALRLQASVRPLDTVARLAGDEFVVMLDNLPNPEESLFIARKIVAAMEKPMLIEEGSVTVGVSIGIAFDAQATLGPEALLSLADSALYEAKAAGRNTYKLSDSRNASRAGITATGKSQLP